MEELISEVNMSDFRATLMSGGYNLLIGSGVSLDSKNAAGEKLRSSEQLRSDLCAITDVNEKTSLQRVCAMLSPEIVKKELVNRYLGCKPGPSVLHVPSFLWRRIFSFNIDDVLENQYDLKSHKKQKLIPINFDSAFEPSPVKGELQIVHLHGWVGKAKSGFVFSVSEYAKMMRSLNPWMHMLSQIIATEPFIIAGTSLNEIDLEYYLSFRNESTPRRGRGPSLLIEPNPDAATISDCNRYGLTLVPATFKAFMDWLLARYPSTPSVYDLTVPDSVSLFSELPTKHELVRFFTDFELVSFAERPLSVLPCSFLYGGEPKWEELDQYIDIERNDNKKLEEMLEILDNPSKKAERLKIKIVSDEPGTGKTTTIRRVAHNMAKKGVPVFSLKTLSRIDIRVAMECFSKLVTPSLVIVDGIADHIEQIVELLDDSETANKIFVLGSERSYRQQHLDVFLDSEDHKQYSLSPLNNYELAQLIERYRKYGLIGSENAIINQKKFIREISQDPVAVAICRIMNDFRPLESIIDSLISESTYDQLLIYICVSLAQHCYSPGIRYSLLQSIVGQKIQLGEMFDRSPLKIVWNPQQDDFVVTLNSAIGEQVLFRSSDRANDIVKNAFVGIANSLAAYVNRKTIMSRSPEARLAQRLFDADKVVKPLLKKQSNIFYLETQGKWEWNSRYWEQRALLVLDYNLTDSLHYAKHAVAIERHPFPLTTLGKVLLRIMESDVFDQKKSFNEAFCVLLDAIKIEEKNTRISIHPYITLLGGTARYLELDGKLSFEQNAKLLEVVSNAKKYFYNDNQINMLLDRLSYSMSI